MPSASFQSLLDRLQSRQALVGIIGLGYVGLPLAEAFIAAGFRVLGFDTDPLKVASLAAGRSYIQRVASESLDQWQRAGVFSATADMTRLAEADALLICVPTPL